MNKLPFLKLCAFFALLTSMFVGSFQASAQDTQTNGDSRQRRFFVQVMPTYMKTEASKTDQNPFNGYYREIKGKRDYYGVSAAFGWQINRFNKLQIETGALFSQKLNCNIVFRYPDYGNYKGRVVWKGSVTDSPFQMLFPEVISYNFCIPLGSVWQLSVGPGIGVMGIFTQGGNYRYYLVDVDNGLPDPNSSLGRFDNEYELAFTVGGNVSLNAQITKSFYMQLGFRYLYVSSAGEHKVIVIGDTSMNALSGNLSVGWRF